MIDILQAWFLPFLCAYTPQLRSWLRGRAAFLELLQRCWRSSGVFSRPLFCSGFKKPDLLTLLISLSTKTRPFPPNTSDLPGVIHFSFPLNPPFNKYFISPACQTSSVLPTCQPLAPPHDTSTVDNKHRFPSSGCRKHKEKKTNKIQEKRVSEAHRVPDTN